MKLTDREYLTLASITLPVDDDGKMGMTVRELLGHSAAEAEAGTQADRRLHDLVLTDRWIAQDATGYAFNNEHDDRWFIFSYTPEASLKELKALLSGESSLLGRAAEFLRAGRGSGACFVTGFGLGGALALYAAAYCGDAGGVVFDAPGIAHLLDAQQANSPGIRNIAADHSVISPLGSHGETVEFAKPLGEPDGEAARLGQAGPHMYETDAAGRIILGEPDDTFGLLSKLNVLLEDGPVVDDVSGAFIRAAGLQDTGAKDLIHALLPLSERTGAKGIRDALLDIAAKYDDHVERIWLEWKQDMTERAEKLGPGALSVAFEIRSEAAMREASAVLEEMYRVTEAFLVVLILFGPDHSRVANRLDELLETVAGGMTARLELLSRQMPNELEALMDISMSKMFVWPDLQFTFKEEGP
ncbi:hypothetical protein G5B47_10430 [Paenibacillus sp. 7124]|uniref:Uncharacterized protein n=1 Tax=Paenibacillus apii TaxID=1850370 RepID=A0A6M1PHB5_9BACL|nr:hypothetical protein [Paenibacillus apii]NGM82829.1 hypothetical protein [Paenibacillus apii]NJJ39969.1 hypothetical protein [Paenibacillus apii]